MIKFCNLKVADKLLLLLKIQEVVENPIIKDKYLDHIVLSNKEVDLSKLTIKESNKHKLDIFKEI